jgi:hypothetical protein
MEDLLDLLHGDLLRNLLAIFLQDLLLSLFLAVSLRVAVLGRRLLFKKVTIVSLALT